jgi:hypothetical protein
VRVTRNRGDARNSEVEEVRELKTGRINERINETAKAAI